LRYRDCMIVWTPINSFVWNHDEKKTVPNPRRGEIRVGLHPHETDSLAGYDKSTGACHWDRKSMTPLMQVAFMLVDFYEIITHDGLNPRKVHKAFLAIDEFRWVISPDMEGAEPAPEEWAKQMRLAGYVEAQHA